MSRIGPFSLVIFDCDGTLVDSQFGIVAAMAEAFTAMGLPAPALDRVRRVVGLNLDVAIAALAPEEAPERHHALVENYKKAFFKARESGAYTDPLFPGMLDAVDILARRGVRLGIATGKSRRGLRAVLDRHGLGNRFVTLQTADDAPGKPHPGMVLNAMSEAGVGPDATVVVGDTTFDMAMARAAQATALGVGWGYHPVEELASAGAARVIDDFAQLVPALEAIGARS